MATSLVDELIHKLRQGPARQPRRVVTRSGWRVRGITPSARFLTPLTWESDIEHRLIYRLLASWIVADACTQAVRLTVPASSAPCGSIDYTPDALVKDRSGTLTCVECKPAEQLDDPEVRLRHRDIKLHLKTHDVRFVEVTESDLAEHAPHENAKLLFRGIQSFGRYTKTGELREKVQHLLPCTFTELTARCGTGSARAALFHGFGFFDMHRQLSGDTLIVPQLEEHFDAAHFLFS